MQTDSNSLKRIDSSSLKLIGSNLQKQTDLRSLTLIGWRWLKLKILYYQQDSQYDV